MKKMMLRAVSVFSALSIFLFSISTSYAAEAYTSLHSLTTSNDKDNYATITAVGDDIEITGRFTDLPLYSLSLSGTGTEDVHIKTTINTDSSFFSSTINCVPDAEFAFIDFAFQDGHQARYRIDYDKGWYFRNYPYASELLPCIKKYKVADDEATVGYVTENYDEDEYIAVIEELEQIAFEETQSCVTNYERAKALFRWVCETLAYDKDVSRIGFGIEEICLENVLANRHTTCAGFANLYCALLGAIDIRGVTVSGFAVSNEIPFDELSDGGVYHEWTAFWLEDENRWVNADPCWGCENDYSEGKTLIKPINMQFFDIDTLAVSQFHRAEKAEYREYFSAEDYFINAETSEDGFDERPGEVVETETDDSSRRSDYHEGEQLLPAMIIISCGVVALLFVFGNFSKKKHK